MNYLIDTCVVSELRKPVPDESVLTWFQSCDAEKLYISSLSIGELHYGISLLPDGKKKNDVMIWFNQVIDVFSGRILSITDVVSIIWGNMRAQARKKGLVLPVIDGLLAATAEAHHLVLVTRNIKDMEITGALFYDPWER